ncbi:hypothetical protein GCM10027429_29110 [Marivirga atlantica]|jgi:uncharacterized membrane protein (DUF2068 family)|uniref:Uncharacterized protein n=1 Tax=Marivirga atlantica TaxID=1548457 RepID=A0A937DK05_9BACT|nr:hypothetical protein [Marivirga atlantica]MBL0766490.1 hypothetical protein [Marivirga atlantica]
MKLITRCASCGSFKTFHAKVSDRFDLVKNRGEKVELSCKSCNANLKYDPNNIKAVENKRIYLVAALIFAIGSIAIFVGFWPYLLKSRNAYFVAAFTGVVTVPFLIYQNIHHSQENRIKYFNTKRYG